MNPSFPRLAAAVALAAALAAPAGVARAARITGVVVDGKGAPIEFANVAAPAAKIGALTDERGAFTLELPDGAIVLEVQLLGYQTARVTLTAGAGATPLRIVLREAPVPVEEVVVAASSFGKTGKSEGATLRRFDVVTTPGGAADVFQSLRALPSINAPDEGAALYVRGGDPSETLIRIDGGEIGHPYHYEGASGGLFSAFDSYMLKGAFFSSGGFSAQYGGVMSGVLDIETQDPLNLRTVTLGGNLVGASLSTSWALVPNQVAFVGSLRGSNVALLDRLYPASDSYVQAPASADYAGRLLYRYSPTGRLALLALGAGDQTSLMAQRLNYEAIYRQRSRNEVLALQLHDVVASRLALKGQISAQGYRTDWSYGPQAVRAREARVQANLDALWQFSERNTLAFGANLRRRTDDLSGTYLADSTDYGPGAPVAFHAASPRLDTPGFYLEDKARIWGPLYATFGGRFDYASLPDVWTADPRAALAWRMDEHQTVRVAAGRYHQPAGARYLDPVYGNPALEPMRADHVIAGYEYARPTFNFRIEAYRKDYFGLITTSAETYYANQGRGYARGVDVFMRGQRGPVSGWISYGFQDSRRREGDDPVEVPSRYGVPHTLTVVGGWTLPGMWMLGGRFGWSSGRVYTPIAGAVYDAARGAWRPIEGARNGARLPDYRRLDMRVTKLFALPALAGLPGSSTCALYAEAMNVLGIENVLDYVYNADYTERRENLSYFSRRIVVAGFSLTW